jgi:paraquat-inducible protein A
MSELDSNPAEPIPSISVTGNSSERRVKACHCCGLIQSVATAKDVAISVCPRCGAVVDRCVDKGSSRQRTAAAAFGAMLLFPAAIVLPILEIEKLGHHYTSSILGGIIELYHEGSLIIATIILLFSIVLPVAKLLTLLELCWFRWLEHHHRSWAYRVIEFSGRWSMMDVMLLAFLVMLIKLSGMVEFHIGPAAVAFAGCVVMSMIASMSFDPPSIWEEDHA